MAQYYYLISSLPHIVFGEKPFLKGEEFVEECEKWLSEKDKKTLFSSRTGDHKRRPEDTFLLEKWKEFDLSLKESLAVVRGGKKSGKSYKVPEQLKQVMEQETPLLSERILEKTRWEFVEGLEAGQQFNINRLVCYFLKLQISERLSSFEKDKGESYFYKFCEVDHEQALWQDSSY